MKQAKPDDFITKFDKFMDKINRKEVLTDSNQNPYLIRYVIFGRKKTTKTYRGRGLYIQKLIRLEKAQHLHDYPWRWGRFILKGQFIETSRKENSSKVAKEEIARFHLTPYSSSRLAHSQALITQEPVWMLFWHGKYKHHWGFWINNEKVYWKEYFKQFKHKGTFI
jgi:hypothetical protein